MNIGNNFAKTSFSARLNKNTRQLIREIDKVYKQNLEYRIDKTIEDSQFADFYDDKATISFVETENPYCNIAPVINIDINGITASHILNGSSSVCEEQDEEFLLEKMQRRPYSYINTIEKRLSSETLAQVKKALAIDYLNQTQPQSNTYNVDSSTLDRIINSEA